MKRRGSLHRGKTLLTHDAIKRINMPDVVDTGRQGVDISVTTALKHWFDMNGVHASPISGIPSVRDYIGAQPIVENTDSDVGTVPNKQCTLTGAAPYSIKCGFASTATWKPEPIPEKTSRLLFLVAKARFPTPHNIGGGIIAWAGYSDGIRVRSNRISYSTGADEDINDPTSIRRIWTGNFCRGSQRVKDTNYAYGAAYRYGEKLEHYSYHDQEDVTRLVGGCDVSDFRAQNRLQREIDFINAGNPLDFWLSHGVARNDPNAPNTQKWPMDDTSILLAPPEYYTPNDDVCGGLFSTKVGSGNENANDNPSDYYGLMIYYFKELPQQHVIEAALEWCRAEWPNGNKVAPPHFTPYL